MKNKWIAHERIKDKDNINLLCFIFDGGSAGYFAPWKYQLSEKINLIPILYPVREKRRDEEMYEDMQSFVEDLVMNLQDLFKGRYAFFGYCSGAVIAYETAALAKKKFGVDPEYGMIISSDAPKYLAASVPICTEENKENIFYEHVSGLPTISDEMLKDKVFMQYFLPLMTADYKILRSYKYKENEKLKCDIDIIMCPDDPKVSREKVEEWKKLVSGKAEVIEKSGGHFLVETQKNYIFETLNNKLANEILEEPADIQKHSTILHEMNKVDKIVFDCWEKIFDISNLDLEDNFFFKGGDSFKATKIISILNKEFNIQLGINDIFNNPTVLVLSEYISKLLLSQKMNEDDIDEGEI